MIFGLLLILGMSKHLDHDEHQFVASGTLLARRGLLPYRDYPYFHMPNLVFVDALLFRCCGHLLLAARALSIACSFGTTAVTFLIARRLFVPFGSRTRWLAEVLAAAVLITQPLFAKTSGRAWNHDLPVLLTLLAFLAALRACARPRPAIWQVCAGALLGLAIGTRLTFAPASLALAAMIWMRPGTVAGKTAGVGRLIAGATIAMAPSLWLLTIAPRQFEFGNFMYPGLNTVFHQESGYIKAMTATGKLLYLFTDVLSRPASLLFFVALAGSFAALLRARSRGAGFASNPHHVAIISLVLMIGCLLAGAFAATPLFPVYFYAPMPFALLLILYVAADPRADRSLARRAHRKLALLGIAAVALGMVSYDQVTHPRDLLRWVPIDVHQTGRELGRNCSPGRVLTLSPIFALEGGADIYEELATGPFAMRAGARVSESNEALYKLMDEEDLPEIFDRRPPSAVLTGFERGSDDAISSVARARGFIDRAFRYYGKTLLLQTPPSKPMPSHTSPECRLQYSISAHDYPVEFEIRRALSRLAFGLPLARR